MDGINIKIRLETLTHHKRTEKWGKAEPYLWTIFFKMDGSCIDITPQFKIDGNATFHFTEGSHGNLGISSRQESNQVPIPSAVGKWETYLDPVRIPYFEQDAAGIAGVIVVLMEKNNVSYEGAEAGHHALNEKVEAAVNQTLKEFDPKIVDIENAMPSIRKFFEDKVEIVTDSLQDDIVNAIKSKQKLLQNIWTLLKPDNLIGYRVWNFSQADIMESDHQSIDFSHLWASESHGDWEIFGNVSAIEDNFE